MTLSGQAQRPFRLKPETLTDARDYERNGKMTKRLNLRISSELFELLKANAQVQGLSLNAYMISVLNEKIDRKASRTLPSKEADQPVKVIVSDKAASLLRKKIAETGMTATAIISNLIIFEKFDFKIFGFNKALELYDLINLYKEELAILSENLNDQLINNDDPEKIESYLRQILYNQLSVKGAFDRYYLDLKKYQLWVKNKLIQFEGNK